MPKTVEELAAEELAREAAEKQSAEDAKNADSGDEGGDSKTPAQFTQADLDRAVTKAVNTSQRKFEERIAKEREDAERREEERKIREEGNMEKIAKLHEKRASELQKKLDEAEKKQTVTVILDEAKITDPDERAILSKLDVPLTELPVWVERFSNSRKPAIAAAVAAQLQTGGTPPKGTPPPDRSDLAARLAEEEAKGTPEGRRNATAIRNQMSNVINARANVIP